MINFIAMKTRKHPLQLIVSMAVLSILITSCGKWRERRDMTTSKDQNQIEGLFDDMYKIVDNAAGSTAGIKLLDMQCVDTLLVDTTANPKTMLIDFGQDDCISADGRIRKGQLYVTFTGRYRTAGTVITITPSNYSVDGYNIIGTKTITNEGLNANNQPYFSVSVEAQVIAPNNEWTTSWSGTRTRVWTEGYNTLLNPYDDVYEITGSGSGINRNGVPFTMTIDEALVAKMDCPWIVQGELTITPDEGSEKIINWGSGECNNGMTVVCNGNMFTINGGN